MQGILMDLVIGVLQIITVLLLALGAYLAVRRPGGPLIPSEPATESRQRPRFLRDDEENPRQAHAPGGKGRSTPEGEAA